MAELKTQKTKASVAAFLNAIEDPQLRKDCKVVAGIMRKATDAAPRHTLVRQVVPLHQAAVGHPRADADEARDCVGEAHAQDACDGGLARSLTQWHPYTRTEAERIVKGSRSEETTRSEEKM